MTRTSSRHDRQVKFAGIGQDGQARIHAARVAVLGCGALGCAVADMLTRAGVGQLILIDRDIVELSNLQRQSLFDEQQARQGLPKAVAAAERLRRIDSGIVLDPRVLDATAGNLPEIVRACTVVIDGTDNFATRHLLNEACIRSGVPWIYGACVGAYGCSATILPGITPCLRCLQDQLPATGDSPTCDTVGIIAPAVQMVASWQVSDCLRLLVADAKGIRHELRSSDLWQQTYRTLRMEAWRDPGCPVCGPNPTYPLLSRGDEPAIVLCGRDAVQIRREPPVLSVLASHVGDALEVSNEYLIRFRIEDISATCFRDGRVIVQGVHDASSARGFCDRYFG